MRGEFRVGEHFGEGDTVWERERGGVSGGMLLWEKGFRGHREGNGDRRCVYYGGDTGGGYLGQCVRGGKGEVGFGGSH